MSETQDFLVLTRKPYAEQAKFYLNGFWKEGADKEAENIWKCTHKFIELDPKGKVGCELDEFSSHKFLEYLGETLTVLQLREKLRKIDLDLNGKMAILEYFAFRYNKAVSAIIISPQGDNSKEVDEAAAKLQAVQDAMADVQRQLESQTKAVEESKAAEEVAKSSLDSQKKAEDIVRQAEADLKAAIDDLKNQETTYNTQVKTLEDKSKDTTISAVQRSKASAELAQLKQEDPMPLRKAKITQEAALRKVEKERKAAEAATAVAAGKAADAEAKSRALEEQKKKVEAAYVECENSVKEATDFLESVKKKGGIPNGSMWWMERELTEAKKYMPKRKQ